MPLAAAVETAGEKAAAASTHQAAQAPAEAADSPAAVAPRVVAAACQEAGWEAAVAAQSVETAAAKTEQPLWWTSYLKFAVVKQCPLTPYCVQLKNVQRI